MAPTLNSATPLNGAVLLDWTVTDISNNILSNPAPVAGYITVFDTVKRSVTYVSLSPDEMTPPLNPDQSENVADARADANIKYTVKGLTNGSLYVFTLNIYKGSLENIVATASKQATPSTVPSAPLMQSYNVVSLASGVKITANLSVPSSNGLDIDYLNLYIADMATFTTNQYTYLSQSLGLNGTKLTAMGFSTGDSTTLTDSTIDFKLLSNIEPGQVLSIELPEIANNVNKKNYLIWAEAVNAAGASQASNTLEVSTLNTPSPLTVTSVVSGLDASFKVSLSQGASNNSIPLDSVTVQFWDITSSGKINGTVAGTIRTQTFSAKDTFGKLILKDLVVNSSASATPANSTVYAVAAYATNAYGDGIKASISASTASVPTLQGPFKTVVPAKLPVLSDFIGYASNTLKLTGAINSANKYSEPNGTLGAFYKAATLPVFSFSPDYTFKFLDSNGNVVGDKTVSTILANADDQSASVSMIVEKLDTKVGGYSARVEVATSVPPHLAAYFGPLPAPLSFSLPAVQLSEAPKSAPRDAVAIGFVSDNANSGSTKYQAMVAAFPTSTGGVTFTPAMITGLIAKLVAVGGILTTAHVVTVSGLGPISQAPGGAAEQIRDVVNGLLGAEPISSVVLPITANVYGIELMWQAPSDNGNSAIRGYKVELFDRTTLLWAQFTATNKVYINATGVAQVVDVAFTGSPALSGANAAGYGAWLALAVEKPYTAVITAYNANGAGLEKLTLNNIYVKLTPDGPASVTVTPAIAGSALAPGLPRPFNVSWTAGAANSALIVSGNNIYVYDDKFNQLSSAFTVDATYKLSVPASLKRFYVGVQTVASEIATGARHSSDIVFSTLQSSNDAPTITIGQNAFQENSAGNGVFYFTVNNGGSTLTGLTVFVVPDPSVAITQNPLDVNDTAAVVATPQIVDPVNGNIATYQVDLGYKVPANPGFLIVASNATGSNFLARNLA